MKSHDATGSMLKMFAFSRHRFDTTAKATALLDLLESSPYPPAAFNTAEPIRQKLTKETRSKAADLLSGAPQHRAGTLFLSSSRPRATWMFRWVTGATNRWYAEIATHEVSRPGGREEVVQFLLALFREFPVVFAGVAADSEWDAKHWITKEDENGDSETSKLGLELGPCLPGVYWMTVFGDQLTSHFGRKKLLASDSGAVDLGKPGVAIVSSADPVKDQPKLHADEQRILESLGKTYFFDIAAPSRPCAGIPGVTNS